MSADAAATIVGMAVEQASPATLDAVEDLELRELTAAATWYFKYHEGMIAKLADDPSAYAVARREKFLRLHSALRKLGVRLVAPF